MDSFSMRNFTNASVFDDTLPTADGLIEIGAKVPIEALREAMEDWFRRKSYLPRVQNFSLLSCNTSPWSSLHQEFPVVRLEFGRLVECSHFVRV